MGRTDVTRMLSQARAGDDAAVNQLLPVVYDELRALAQNYLTRERPDHTLQATALVHEAYVRLIKQDKVEWESRAHFFAVAAQAIRRILVDHARTHGRQKRGGAHQQVEMSEASATVPERDMNLVALDEALSNLEQLNPRQAKIVELRYFGGLSLKEVAEVLAVSPRTVDGDWAMARAWLRQALTEDHEP